MEHTAVSTEVVCTTFLPSLPWYHFLPTLDETDQERNGHLCNLTVLCVRLKSDNQKLCLKSLHIYHYFRYWYMGGKLNSLISSYVNFLLYVHTCVCVYILERESISVYINI